MNWEALGAIGEILGAVAVVATLVYLSRQITQNSKALTRANDYAQASSIHDSNAMYVQVFSQLALDAELASIYHRGLAKETLDDVEAVRYAALINTYFAFIEEMSVQVKVGLGFSEFMQMDLQELLEFGYPYWGRLLDTEAGMAWWTDDAPFQYSPDFVRLVNEILTKDRARRSV